jgi:hypothetical protein
VVSRRVLDPNAVIRKIAGLSENGIWSPESGTSLPDGLHKAPDRLALASVQVFDKTNGFAK